MNYQNKMFMLLTAVAVAATACNNQQKNNDMSSSNNPDTTATIIAVDTNQWKQDWEKFKADAREKIKNNDDSLELFKTRVNKVGKKMAAKLDKRIDELKQKNEELKQRLDNAGEQTKEKWLQFKTDFTRDMDTVGVHLKELVHKNQHS